MKKLLLLNLMLASGACLANSWYGASDIKKEEYVTPGVKGGFSKIIVTERKLTPEEMKKKILKAGAGQVTVYATAQNSSGRAGQYTQVRGHHQACFFNRGNGQSQLGYRFTLATLGNTALSANTLPIPAGTQKCVETDSFLNVYTRGEGDYAITAYTVGAMNNINEQTHGNAVLSVSE